MLVNSNLWERYARNKTMFGNYLENLWSIITVHQGLKNARTP